MNLLAYSLLWLIAALFPLTDADVWWHLATAREMFAQGTLLYTDPFTYTALGQTWTNVHWLYQLLIYGIYNAFGAQGAMALVVFHAMLWTIAAWAWTKPKQSLGAWAFVVPLLWATHFLLLARPLVLTLLILGLQKRLFEQERLSRLGIAGIMALQVVLANVQGLFLLGPIFLVLQGVAQKYPWRKVIAISGAMLCVSSLHPAGPRVLLYPCKLLWRLRPGNLFAERISENASPLHALLSPFHLQGSGTAETWAALALLVLTVFLIWNWIHKTSRLWMVELPLLILAWLSLRNIPLLLIVALPHVLNHTLEGRQLRIHKALGLSMLVALALAQVQWWRVYPAAVAPFRYSDGAMQWLNSHGSWNAKNPLRLFCETRQGGYAEWKNYPKILTHIDGRLILRDEAFFQEYLSLADDVTRFDSYAMRFQIDAVLLPVSYPTLFQGLAAYLGKSPQWDLVFVDESAWLFLNKNAAGTLAGNPWQIRPSALDSIWADFGVRSQKWSPLVAREGHFWLLHSVSIISRTDF